VTITAGRLLGLNRDAAARFAFMLLIPSTFAAIVYEGVGVLQDGLPDGVVGPMLVGIAASAVSGYAAIWGLLRFVRQRSYDIFVGYRFVVAIVVLGIIASGWREPTF
jgi:undecaprenyl-diphosphatase